MQKDYTKEAEMALAAYMRAQRNFDGPTVMNDDGDANLSLRDASALIKQAALEKARILKSIQEQRGAQQELEEVRENVGILPDREALKIQSGWIQQSKLQAKNYADSVNRGSTPRAFDPNDKEQRDIRDGVISWIKKQKLRGNFGGRKTLNKN